MDTAVAQPTGNYRRRPPGSPVPLRRVFAHAPGHRPSPSFFASAVDLNLLLGFYYLLLAPFAFDRGAFRG